MQAPQDGLWVEEAMNLDSPRSQLNSPPRPGQHTQSPFHRPRRHGSAAVAGEEVFSSEKKRLPLSAFPKPQDEELAAQAEMASSGSAMRRTHGAGTGISSVPWDDYAMHRRGESGAREGLAHGPGGAFRRPQRFHSKLALYVGLYGCGERLTR